ncbi:FAD-dependent monooxygenase [Roseomonas marmotae]|uniref:FAD-dependent monooxygenase n=1 Tax=Roseomonas marmotae TaxID=2768161 RepID=A0ABS3K8Q1_9PROT|nr:FAD-dependent monooxygenase [Roseomonas marmotae]MBO1073843.1 FAD-dependent monooxygenase [Roseomonas marmotae]QTI78528.1 FAD-dependent monooxygenase [Roseomonas marmotae]
MHSDILIVGAGPTGLVLALWLMKQGVRPRIVDSSSGPGTTSRAMGVQARTLELYRQLDLAEAVVAAGHRNPGINLWVRGRRRAHLSFGSAGAAVTPYPFLLVYPQDRHEQLLVAWLAAMGVTVERRTELLGFEERGDHVLARLRGPGGEEQFCEARYLAGCDGARSPVRHQLGAGFEGGTYRQLFYVADVETSGLTPPDEIHVCLDSADFVVLLAYGGTGQARLIGTVRDERAGRAETLGFGDVSDQAIRGLGLRIGRVNWFSTYRVHHRVTDRFRRGRVFLLGDAAHVHSPAGGQGMNTGIGDAINLAWKLVAVLKGEAAEGLLDSYETERLGFAHRLVRTTDRVFSTITAEGRLANLLRSRVAPLIASAAYRVGPAREFLFRVISQTKLHYRESPLSDGLAGRVRGGDRLPWVSLDGAENYAPLSDIGWQVHVYGHAGAALRDWCGARGMPLHVQDWHPRHGEAGLARDAAYLLRPDTYVALADPAADPARLARYFSEHAFIPGRGG